MHGQGGFGSCYLCGTRGSEDLCIDKTVSKQLAHTIGSRANDKYGATGYKQARGQSGEARDAVPVYTFSSSDTEAFVIRLSIHSITHTWARPFLFISSREGQSCTFNSSFLSSFLKAENLSHMVMEHRGVCLGEKPGCALSPFFPLQQLPALQPPILSPTQSYPRAHPLPKSPCTPAAFTEVISLPASFPALWPLVIHPLSCRQSPF